MLTRFLNTFGQQRLLGGAFVLAMTQFGASVAGLLRDYSLNRTYPGLSTVDVYISSFRLSDLLFQITIMAGISTVLVPLLSTYKAHDNHEETSRLLSAVLHAGSIAFGAIAIALIIFFPFIAPKLVAFTGSDLELYIFFGRLALFTNFLFVFGNALGQYLITVQKYWIYGITPIIYTFGTVLGTVLLSPFYGEMAPMIGTVAGAVLYVAIRLFGAVREGFRLQPFLWHADLKKMGWLMLPRMLALGALQAELLVFDSIASGLDSGAVTINANARNFQSVIVGVVGIALAQSAFPLLSNAAAKREYDRFKIYVLKGIQLLLLLTIPGAVILGFMAPVAAQLVHLQNVLSVFWSALIIYCISIPFESMNHLLLRSFYALHKTSLPAICNVLNGTIAILASFYFAPTYGVYALAIGFTVGQIVQMLGLMVMLPKAVRGLRYASDAG